MLEVDEAGKPINGIIEQHGNCAYDYDKHPHNLRAWITLIGNLVRSLEFGLALELFLDNYLKRGSPTNHTKPAFLDDPALSIPQPRSTAQAEPDEAESDSISQILHGIQWQQQQVLR